MMERERALLASMQQDANAACDEGLGEQGQGERTVLSQVGGMGQKHLTEELGFLFFLKGHSWALSRRQNSISQSREW